MPCTVMRVDVFGEIAPAQEPDDLHAARRQDPGPIKALPEFPPPSATATPTPATIAGIDAWARHTQRIYLLWLVGAIQRGTYRDSSIANARYVLLKLNGLGGQW